MRESRLVEPLAGKVVQHRRVRLERGRAPRAESDDQCGSPNPAFRCTRRTMPSSSIGRTTCPRSLTTRLRTGSGKRSSIARPTPRSTSTGRIETGRFAIASASLRSLSARRSGSTCSTSMTARPHTVASELLDDERLQLARPRPAPERVQALGVDDDEDDVVGRRARLEPDPAVVDQPIDLARRLEPVEHGAREHQRAQEPEQPQQGDPAPPRAARSALGEVLHVPTDAIPERAFNAVPSAPRAGSRADRSTSASSARRRAVGASCGGGSRACRRCAC